MQESPNTSEWQDSRGRYFRVELLDERDPELAHGNIVGPPLEVWDTLKGYPESVRLRVHNELYHRGLFTEDDVHRHPVEVEAALRAALKLDVGRIMEAYSGNGNEDRNQDR